MSPFVLKKNIKNKINKNKCEISNNPPKRKTTRNSIGWRPQPTRKLHFGGLFKMIIVKGDSSNSISDI